MGAFIIGFVSFALLSMAVFAGIQFIAERYGGVKFHGKFGYSSAKEQSDNDKKEYELLASVDPKCISKAIERCKKKKYRLTYSNILREYGKL